MGRCFYSKWDAQGVGRPDEGFFASGVAVSQLLRFSFLAGVLPERPERGRLGPLPTGCVVIGRSALQPSPQVLTSWQRCTSEQLRLFKCPRCFSLKPVRGTASIEGSQATDAPSRDPFRYLRECSDGKFQVPALANSSDALPESVGPPPQTGPRLATRSGSCSVFAPGTCGLRPRSTGLFPGVQGTSGPSEGGELLEGR